MARVAVLRLKFEPIGRTTRRLEDASDRTTGESIKSAVCNTEVTEEAPSFFAMTKYIILIIYLITNHKKKDITNNM